MRAIDASLRRLQTDRIDLYMAHEVDPLTDIAETMGAFDDLIRAGKVLYVGFCNIEPRQVEDSLATSERNHKAQLVAVQNEYNLLHRAAEAEMLPLLASKGKSFVAFSPMAGGWLSGKYREGTPAPEGSRMTLRPEPYAGLQNPATYQAIERFRAASSSFGVSMGALALAWAASHHDVTSVLAGPRNLDQFKAIDEALQVSLGDDDRKRIAEQMAGQVESRA